MNPVPVMIEESFNVIEQLNETQATLKSTMANIYELEKKVKIEIEAGADPNGFIDANAKIKVLLEDIFHESDYSDSEEEIKEEILLNSENVNARINQINKTNSLFAPILLNNLRVRAVIDTGAEGSFIHPQLLQELNVETTPVNGFVYLACEGSTTKRTQRTVPVAVRHGTKLINACFISFYIYHFIISSI